MSLGVVGQKCGMTRIFFKNGDSIPATVIYIKSNLVTQIKTMRDNGYCAIQVTTGIKKTISS
jgi:large subunit ribosomal protein L3